MYKKISAYTLPILVLLLFAITAWGFQVRDEKQSILIKAENQYQRSFHELNANVKELNLEISNVEMINQPQSQRETLANVWRVANLAQNNISQLPLAFLPFQETQELLYKISNFAYQTSIRDLKSTPLTQQERQLVQRLHKRTGEIADDLQKVQTAVIQKKLRWMDVELAMIDEKSQRDNMIIDGFKLVNQKVTAYDDLHWGPSMQTKDWAQDPISLGQKPIADGQLKRRAEQYTNAIYVREVKRKVLNEKGLREFILKTKRSKDKITLHIDRYSGLPIWYMSDRKIGKANLNNQAALDKAEKYLRQRSLNQMKMVSFDRYEQIASITFVQKKHNVLIYPHKIVVNVALDRGDIVAFQSELTFADSKVADAIVLSKDVMTEEKARSYLNHVIKIKNVQLAMIQKENKNIILCYQFDGTMEKQHARIFLNAKTGVQEKIEWLNDIEI